jgi:hypothetical protein
LLQVLTSGYGPSRHFDPPNCCRAKRRLNPFQGPQIPAAIATVSDIHFIGVGAVGGLCEQASLGSLTLSTKRTIKRKRAEGIKAESALRESEARYLAAFEEAEVHQSRFAKGLLWPPRRKQRQRQVI